MSLSGIFGRIVALIGAAHDPVAAAAGRRARAGHGQRAGDPGGEVAGQHPDAEDADGARVGRGQTPVAAPGSRSMRSRAG